VNGETAPPLHYARPMESAYDVVVIGAGPNGLAAAITCARSGLAVLVLEGAKTVGGGLRSAALTLPGYVHDVCSAIHPLALVSLNRSAGCHEPNGS
jgi:phytoene dehydrogenase-like protein